jgi:hypothetical protein
VLCELNHSKNTSRENHGRPAPVILKSYSAQQTSAGTQQITAEHDLLETGPSVTWRAMTFQLSPSLMLCPDTSPDREDNDAGQPAARGGEHPVCSGD